MKRRPRRQRIDSTGINGVKIGAPPLIGDLYYTTMEMSWPVFVALVSLAYLLVNLAFGLVYAALPGAIGNATPGSIADGFFFSVETLGTVGYGNMAPATRLGHSIAAVEILVGLFFSATMTGLIFARFARPRNCFVFSEVAVIGRYEGRPALMVRLASTRARPLADVTAQVSWLERVDLHDGRVFRRLIELPLVRAHNPTLALSWTLVHPIEAGSRMIAALDSSAEFRLSVTVTGLDTLLAAQAIGGQTYLREAILRDHEFTDAVEERNGSFELDLGKLHAARAIADA
jgi:inward rectifier potassium channel